MLKAYAESLISLILPRTCPGCNKALRNKSGAEIICHECWSSLKKNIPPFCHRCGRHINIDSGMSKICPECESKVIHFDRAFSPCIYEGLVKELIHKFKYGQRDDYGRILSRLLVEFIKEYNLPPIEHFDMLIPIPLHKQRLREREFNQSEILARYLSEEFPLQVSSDILLRNRNTVTQTGLTQDERCKNVENSFSVENVQKLKGKMVILIDDVLTTGATCSEAARVLKENGASIVFVLTAAN